MPIDEYNFLYEYSFMTNSETTYKNISTKKLEKRVHELKNLCQELDPYSDISKHHISILEKYDVEIHNPFAITNKLLLLLEGSLEELERRKEQLQ